MSESIINCIKCGTQFPGDINSSPPPECPKCFPKSAFDRQVGGNYYKQFKIQPFEFFWKNKIEHSKAAIIRRILRYDQEGGKGLQDLEKIIHECQLLAELNGYDKPSAKENAIKAGTVPLEKESRVTDKDAGTLYNDRTAKGNAVNVNRDMENPNMFLYLDGEHVFCKTCGDYLMVSKEDRTAVLPCSCVKHTKEDQIIKYFSRMELGTNPWSYILKSTEKHIKNGTVPWEEE